MSVFVTPSRFCAICVLLGSIHVAPAHAQAHGLVVEPAPPLEVPAGAELLHISGTINNNQPVAATDPQFSTDICDLLRAPHARARLGDVRSQLTSEGEFTGTHIGEATVHVQACLFAPPPTIIALLTITAEDGGVLTLSVQALQVRDSPPPQVGS